MGSSCKVRMASSLLTTLSLTPEQDSAVACILAAVVADAATRPFHWLYDLEELKRVIGDEDPEFWPESKSPFYTLPTGSRSCYNHVMIAGLEAFLEAGGSPDLETYKKVLRERFGEGTDWQEALARRREEYSPKKRKTWREPVPGPWLHGAVIHFLEHGHGEEGNTEMDAFLLCVPHLVFNMEKEDVIKESLKIASLLTGEEKFVKCQATVLLHVLRNKTFSEDDIEILDNEVRELTQKVFDKHQEDHVETVSNFGNNCHLPGSYQGALHAFNGSKDKTEQDHFKSAIRKVIRAGGCNCSRANYAGALMGAQAGLKVLPELWVDKVLDLDSILSLALKASDMSVSKDLHL